MNNRYQYKANYSNRVLRWLRNTPRKEIYEWIEEQKRKKYKGV